MTGFSTPDAAFAHEDIHPAEGLGGRLDQPLHVGDLAHVRPHDDGFAAQRPRFGGCLFGLFGMAEVVDRHVRAVARQFERNGAADAAPAARDDGRLAAQDVVGTHGPVVRLTQSRR